MFSITFFVLLALSIVYVYNGYTHDSYPHTAGELGASTYADVQGSILSVHLLYPDQGKEIHVHGIVFSHDDHATEGGHANGNYTLVLVVSAPEEGANYDDDWWEEDFGANRKKEIPHVDSFTDGCRVEDDISITAKNLGDVRAVEYIASAYVKNGVGSDSDFIKKPVGKYNEESGIGNNDIGTSNTGISLANSSQTSQPGDSVTLNLATSEPYYSVSWYVKTPWDTSETGTYLEDDYGDGTSTEASLTYSFPSGTMHTGDFIFAADIYRWVDMSWQSKETYTVSVSNPTVPSIPQSVSASPGQSRWSVSLSWAAPSSDGGSAITGYEYQYRRYYAGTWESWSSWQSVSSTSTTVTGLISNGTYEFRLRAVNSVGTSSNTDSVTTTAQ
ncbi:fibronectin type III domain-containing protein [Candidatus Poribacteria bacterium]|nr:fibronectin type III domain-containing protein [Candidatus Poribacteria bacterium]MYF54617.1 fibronectin type III domain-containing protein [Candidatus Poribacteria bacterium]MYI93510.1 fibronectin type III domain-containing protein [Candidatus Poribacteria bacterium]